ncbi:UDP-N-acetylmuramate dehydrogenase [Neisseriaceae bacterium ESL0693]|nr:UDP-N-acetylmuramate dehydrogenase [Neisseriaceae bacterium ESL0693]
MITVLPQADLQPLHTFGLPVLARALVTLTDAAQLPQIMQLPEFNMNSVLWLGGGSNVLFAGNYPGLVVRMANRGIRLIEERQHEVVIEAAAGEVWHDFVQYTLRHGLSGLENLSLIPGTVGAAPVQNIGAYGVEVQSCIESVCCFDLTHGQFIRLLADDCAFAYRDSIFKHEGKQRYVITAVRFRLSRTFVPQVGYGDLARIVAQMSQTSPLSATLVAQAVCHIRQSKLPDPRILGNAGSFFKNPIVDLSVAQALLAQYPQAPHYPQPDGRVKLAAGWLIDQCGLKGHQIGGAAVHDKQALVLVNKHQATATDVVALARYIQTMVADRFGVMLSTEPVWLAG